jgi:hypothetical protein
MALPRMPSWNTTVAWPSASVVEVAVAAWPEASAPDSTTTATSTGASATGPVGVFATT